MTQKPMQSCEDTLRQAAVEGILFGGGEWLRWSVITIADRPAFTISRQVNQPWLT